MNEIKSESIVRRDGELSDKYMPEGRVLIENPFEGLPDKWVPKEHIDMVSPEKMSVENADRIYDKLMENAFLDEADKKQEITLEEVFDEIYGRDEDEFSFDEFKLENEIFDKLFKYFSPEIWKNLDYNDKQNVLREFGGALAETLDIKNPPRIAYYLGGNNDCGSYNSRNNEIKINRNMIDDVKETVDTVAHETFHAYQNQRARMLETKKDVLYAINFKNYISPGPDANGNYVNFDAYQSQLVEAEASGFAKQFSEKAGA